ncbi:MAG: DNA topoisomerase IV subunit B, partial [Myxococcota bacterium]
YYVRNDEEMMELEGNLPSNVKPTRMRFKGLGEMNAAQLWETTLDPKRRRALRVQMDNDTTSVMQSLMGKDPSSRFKFIMTQAANSNAEELDV